MPCRCGESQTRRNTGKNTDGRPRIPHERFVLKAGEWCDTTIRELFLQFPGAESPVDYRAQNAFNQP